MGAYPPVSLRRPCLVSCPISWHGLGPLMTLSNSLCSLRWTVRLNGSQKMRLMATFVLGLSLDRLNSIGALGLLTLAATL